MLTCFGSICYIAAQNGTVGPKQLLEMTKLSPLDRLKEAAKEFGIIDQMDRAESQYEWFLKLTNVSEAELKFQFHDKEMRKEAFDRASVFGDSVYEVTRKIASKTGYLRYLVV